MKCHYPSIIPRYIYSACAIFSVFLFLFGCSGSNGTSVGTVSGQVTDTFGNKVAGATITPAPLPQGVTAATADAGGNYTMTLPNGSYTLAFSQAGYAPLTNPASVISGQTTTLNAVLTPNAAAAVNVASAKFAGGSATLTANVATFDPALAGQPVAFTWKDAAGATIGTDASITVAQPTSAAFKAAVAEAIKPLQHITPADTFIDPVDGEPNAFKPIRVFGFLDRVMVVGIPQDAFEKAAITPYTVTATVAGKTFTSTPTVSVPTNTLPFVPNPGLRNVPIGQPVMLQGKNTATWNWTITPPAGSTVTALLDPATRFPHFNPDLVGTYTVKEAVSNITLTIYAGKWVGILVPNANNDPLGILDTACSSNTCHSGSTAFNSAINDKFTQWKQSGHSGIMVQAMNDPAGHYSLTSCGKCHSVGFAQYSSAIKAGGFKEAIDATKFTFKQGAASFVGFDQVLRLSEVQCEACHGPNDSGAHNVGAPANAIAAKNDAVTARVSYSADVCGTCHGEPLRHGRFQEWRESGHGDFETALGEGFSGTPPVIRTSCAGCHTAQGFIQFIQQLQAGNPLRDLSAASLAKLAGVTVDNVQPQTCVTCHLPHNPGTQSGLVGAIVFLRGDYQTGGAFDGNTPLLPAGFQANGVGRGALCITCHNSRNGGFTVAGVNNATLHEDGDSHWGILTAFNDAHEACQGDVLMGRNAYFFGSFQLGAGPQDGPSLGLPVQVGQRSRHSLLADACVTCHLQKTPADPNFGLTVGAPGAGTNHSFGIITDPTKTVNEQINALCAQCHGNFDGTGVQKSFDVTYKTLLTEFSKAILRIKFGSTAAIPAGTTLVVNPGRSPTVVVNGAASITLATFLANAPAAVGTAAVPAANITDRLAKANWNATLVSTDASKGVHNPSFIFNVMNTTITALRAM